jgi:hypothetical protein
VVDGDDPHPLSSLSVAVRYRDATAVRTRQERYDAMKDTNSDQPDAMGETAGRGAREAGLN